MRRARYRGILAVAVAALVVGWVGAPAHAATEALTYHESTSDGRTVLADDGVRRVEVIGDLPSATRVVVLVPGVGNDRAAMLAADPHHRVPAGQTPTNVLTQARALYDAMNADLGSTSHDHVAVVAWLGYVPPSPTLQVLSTTAAQRGAKDLLGLKAVLPPAASVMWVCHSYGTDVCAYAAEKQVPDGMILLASPGVPVDSVAEFAAPVPVWAGRIEDDPVRWAAQLDPVAGAVGLGFQSDPTAPDFGATTLDLGSSGGHSGYFTAGSSALATIAQVADGRGAPGPSTAATRTGTTGDASGATAEAPTTPATGGSR